MSWNTRSPKNRNPDPASRHARLDRRRCSTLIVGATTVIHEFRPLRPVESFGGAHMNARTIIAVLVVLLMSSVASSAQRTRYLRIKERPVVWFDFDCTTKQAYPRVSLDRFVKPYLKKIPYEVGKWGDRAFAYDLNGDGVKELFVPLDCGATGNCNWGVFGTKPARLLGILNGENIWVHRRVSAWSRLTIGSHLSASESLLRTCRFEKGRYHRFGRDFVESGYKNNSPENLFVLEPTCDPNWVPQKPKK